MNRTLIALLLPLLPICAAAGTIYKCPTAEGGTLISNTRIDKNCKVVVSNPETSPVTAKPRPSGEASTPSPASFPRVSENQQQARDNDRRRILEQELASEQKNLEQAKNKLAEQEAQRSGDEKNYQRVLDRLQPYKDTVAQHERNIAALRKELGNLR